MNVMHISLLQKDVGLVQQQDRSPRMTYIQNLLQLAFQVSRVGAKFACRDHIQRALQKLRDPLRGKGFPRAWGAM